MDMLSLTEALIDRVVDIGGSFYLPYGCMPGATRLPSLRQSGEFVERKRHYDPRLLFRNAMWHGYFADQCAPQTCS